MDVFVCLTLLTEKHRFLVNFFFSGYAGKKAPYGGAWELGVAYVLYWEMKFEALALGF